MSSVETDIMALADASWDLTKGPSQSRPGTRGARQDRGGLRVRHADNQVSRAYSDQRQLHPGHRVTRRRGTEVGDVVHQGRSSRDLDIIRTELCEPSWSMSDQDWIRHSAAGRGSLLPSPPPDESRGSHYIWFNRPRPLLRHSYDLCGLGSWCEPAIGAYEGLGVDGLGANGTSSEIRRPGQSGPPSTPRERLLPTPELSPMSTDFVFCPCCGNEEGDRINETWCMASRDKMDAQMEHAMAYIERMRSGSR